MPITEGEVAPGVVVYFYFMDLLDDPQITATDRGAWRWERMLVDEGKKRPYNRPFLCYARDADVAYFLPLTCQVDRHGRLVIPDGHRHGAGWPPRAVAVSDGRNTFYGPAQRFAFHSLASDRSTPKTRRFIRPIDDVLECVRVRGGAIPIDGRIL